MRQELCARQASSGFYINDGGSDSSSRQAQPAVSASKTDEAKHARWFIVRNSETGEPLANRDFAANVNGGQQSGKTDEEGYAKIATDEAQSVNIHAIFTSPKRCLRPN
jgi:hypothetical protein